MSVSVTTLAFIIAVVCTAGACYQQQFASAQLSAAKALLLEREASLSRFVSVAEEVTKTRCSRLSSWSSSSPCNIPACGNVFPASRGFQCTKKYGFDANTCPDCADQGLIRSPNASNVLFSENPVFSSSEVQAFLSWAGSSGKDPYEKQAEIETATLKAWSGIASSTGTSRWFPGSPRGRTSTCAPYDPRIRSWYVAASAGPKDIVIVVDTSGSMANTDCSVCPNRLTLMKNAVKSLLGTLTFNDYFAIVQFSSSGSLVTAGTGLKQASVTNVNAAKTAMNNVYSSGGTNFQSGFDKAFQVLRASSEGSSSCQRIVLFLTDGIAEDSGTIESYIQTQQATLGSRTAAIFTFSMSTGADHSVPRKIACNNSGVWAAINNGVNPLDAMSQYYKFLAGGINSTQPRWVEPYVDAFGLGRMTTTSLSYYDRTTSTPIFVGVAEIDVPLAELTKFVSENQLVAELTNRGSSCPVYNVTHCYLQLLRNAAGYECPSGQTLAQCRSSSSLDEVAACSTGITGGVNALLCDPIRTNTLVSTSGPLSSAAVTCCDCDLVLSPGAIAGVVVGSVVGVAIIIGIIYALTSGGAAASAGGGAVVAATSSSGAAVGGGGGGGVGGSNVVIASQSSVYPPASSQPNVWNTPPPSANTTQTVGLQGSAV